MARGLWRSQVAHRTFNPVVVGPNPTRPASFHGTKIDPLVLYSQMKISFENIDQQNDPFQLFIDSIKNDETKRRYKNILNRFLKLIPNQIYQAGKAYSSLIAGGNYDFNDSFDTGYTMFVSMKYNDPQLMSVISNVLRKHNFGCLPAKHTIHAHKNEKHPMNHLAAKLLSEITKDVSMAI